MNGSEMSEVTTGRVSEYTVTGFNPFESVTIQVSANNNGGEGPRSGGVEGRTDEARKINTVFTRPGSTCVMMVFSLLTQLIILYPNSSDLTRNISSDLTFHSTRSRVQHTLDSTD